VPDVAYHIAKWERGFTKVVNIQGTDHHGTIARVRAGLQAADVGIPQGYPDYVLHTMVRVVKGGEEVKISKRAGSYVTLRDLIEWTSKDAVRFFLLSRKPDTEYTFDVDLAVAQNNDNPVYYVQYAHARICSVLRLAGGWRRRCGSLKEVDLSPLDGPQAQALMLQLAKYPDMLTAAARARRRTTSPSTCATWPPATTATTTPSASWWTTKPSKRARLALVAATAQVLHNGLAVLGVSAPARM
jgi:arginyl-tRNA synthetase